MSGTPHEDDHGRPVLEWIVGIAAAVVVSAIVAFLTYEAVFGASRPPDLRASIERMETIEGGTLIVVAVTNRGDEAAAEVGLEAIVGGGPETVWKEIRFDYVASRAVRKGAFVAEGMAVEAADIRFRIHGYVEP
jgi:uncharacterized protein (TIGR02588 family)